MHRCGALRLGQPRVTGAYPVGCRVTARHPRSAIGRRTCSNSGVVDERMPPLPSAVRLLPMLHLAPGHRDEVHARPCSGAGIMVVCDTSAIPGSGSPAHFR